MKEKKKIPWGLIYVGVTLVVLLAFGLLNREFTGIFAVIGNLSFVFVALAILSTGVFLVLEGEIIRLLLHCQGERVGFWTTLKVGLIGIYYSYITPSSTGGQPAQVVYLLRDKVTAGSSAAVLFIKFFAYQLAFVLCTVISIVLSYGQLQAESPTLIPIIFVGTAINALWIVAIPLLFCAPVLHKACGGIAALVTKCRFLKKRINYVKKVRRFEADFAEYTAKFRKKTRYIVTSVLLSIPQVILQMSVLYLVFRAFQSPVPYLELLCMQTMLQASVSFVPLPGASGAQELGFTMFFGGYFERPDILYTAVLVWRFFTYYIVVIAGALVVVADQVWWRRKQKKIGIL